MKNLSPVFQQNYGPEIVWPSSDGFTVEAAFALNGARHIQFTEPTNQALLQGIVAPLQHEPHFVTLFGEFQLINVYTDDGVTGAADDRIVVPGGYSGAYAHMFQYIRSMMRWVRVGGS